VRPLPAAAVVLITSRRRLSPDARTSVDELRALEGFLETAIDAGVDAIQIREADVAAGLLAACVRRVALKAAGTGVRVLVNDRADIAAATGVDGVHLPAGGLPPSRARLLGPRWLIGRSIHPGESTDVPGADYLLFGTVFATVSKPDIPAAGLEALRAAVQAAQRPVLAIGGITPERAERCAAAGASGVAAIGVFLPAGRTPDARGVRAAVPELRAALARGAAPASEGRGRHLLE
jgi:thiamine-phosphate pyrophosphorylase